MKKSITKILEELEREGYISRCYMHRDSEYGHIQLNIEFDNNEDDEVLNILQKYDVPYTTSVANWEE